MPARGEFLALQLRYRRLSCLPSPQLCCYSLLLVPARGEVPMLQLCCYSLPPTFAVVPLLVPHRKAPYLFSPVVQLLLVQLVKLKSSE